MSPRYAALLPALLAVVIAGCGDSSRTPPPSKGVAPRTTSSPPAEVRYEATYAEGIQFYKPGYPRFVRAVQGLSNLEKWGRWSDGPVVKIEFASPLPRKFRLEVIGAAFGPNIGAPVNVTIGGVTQSIKLLRPLGEPPTVATAEFSLDKDADALEMSIPKPSVPDGPDRRRLGIALIGMRILQE